MTKTTYKKKQLVMPLLTVLEAESTTIRAGSRATGRNGTGAVAGSSHPDLQTIGRERPKLDLVRASEASKLKTQISVTHLL